MTRAQLRTPRFATQCASRARRPSPDGAARFACSTAVPIPSPEPIVNLRVEDKAEPLCSACFQRVAPNGGIVGVTQSRTGRCTTPAGRRSKLGLGREPGRRGPPAARTPNYQADADLVCRSRPRPCSSASTCSRSARGSPDSRFACAGTSISPTCCGASTSACGSPTSCGSIGRPWLGCARSFRPGRCATLSSSASLAISPSCRSCERPTRAPCPAHGLGQYTLAGPHLHMVTHTVKRTNK